MGIFAVLKRQDMKLNGLLLILVYYKPYKIQRSVQ